MKHIITAVSTWLLMSPLAVLAQSRAPSAVADRASLDSAQAVIISFGYFLNNVIIPFLFGLALLVFLVNAARFFFIEGASDEGQKKAKSLMLWGIGAFVFLVSLWGIVNTLVDGLGFDSETAICPDYPGLECGSRGVGDGGGVLPRPGDGDGDPVRPIDPGDPGDPTQPDPVALESGIAHLIWGDYSDIPRLSFFAGPPRATTNTVAITETASCLSAIQTLQLASDVENNQAAFALYKNSSGAWRVSNVTDAHFNNGVTYDADTLNQLVADGATDIQLLHTHQKNHTEDVTITTTGFTPSPEDMELTCDSAADTYGHILVDWNQVWTLDTPAGSCPRRPDEEQHFPTIAAMALLSEVAVGDRNQEYEDLIGSELLPRGYKGALEAYSGNDFDTMSSADILALTAPLQTAAKIDLTKRSPAAFCSSL